VLCNDDAVQGQCQSAQFTKTIGEKHIWSLTASFSVGASISVQAGIPGIVSVREEWHWEVGASSTWTTETDTTETKTMTFPVTVGNRTRVFGTFAWWDSKVELPYEGDLVYKFIDNTQHTFHIQDDFKGAFITDAQADYHSERLQQEESCKHIDHNNNNRISSQPCCS